MNAKEEFIKHIKDRQVKCASISTEINYETVYCNLKVGYNKEEYESFLSSLEFTYDDGYGGQELFGIIWYDDGNWSDRGEYDGSEWWAYNKCPEIPEVLL